MKNYGGMKPRNGNSPDFTFGEKQLDALAKEASAKMGNPAADIKQAVESGRLSDITAKLSPADAKALNEILNDKKKLNELLSSKKAQMLLKNLLK